MRLLLILFASSSVFPSLCVFLVISLPARSTKLILPCFDINTPFSIWKNKKPPHTGVQKSAWRRMLMYESVKERWVIKTIRCTCCSEVMWTVRIVWLRLECSFILCVPTDLFLIPEWKKMSQVISTISNLFFWFFFSTLLATSNYWYNAAEKSGSPSSKTAKRSSSSSHSTVKRFSTKKPRIFLLHLTAKGFLDVPGFSKSITFSL